MCLKSDSLRLLHHGYTHTRKSRSSVEIAEKVSAFRGQGLTQGEIARRVGISEKSVRVWLKRGTAPTYKRRVRRRSIFDPSAAYVLEQWQQGVHEGKQLYEEIRAQGFPGSLRVIQRFIQALLVCSETRLDGPYNEAIFLSLRYFLARYLRTEEDTGKEQEKRRKSTMATIEGHSFCEVYQFHCFFRERTGESRSESVGRRGAFVRACPNSSCRFQIHWARI